MLPALAAEYAVVADARLEMMVFLTGSQVATEVVRRECLSDGTDVIAFTLDREQRGALNGARVDASALPFQSAARECVFLEDETHGFQIKVRSQIHNRQIFVVERRNLQRLLSLTVQSMCQQIGLRLNMPFKIHVHERGELYESRVDEPQRAGKPKRYATD